MSDNIDDQDISFNEGAEAEAAPAKAKGAGPGILRILMIVGIALGAVILIVTVVVVTVGIMNSSGKPVSQRPVSEAYQAATPEYQYIGTIAEVRTRTIDAEPHTAIVKINLGLDKDDKDGPVEINARAPQIADFLRHYFAMKSAADLAPENEEQLKAELLEQLNGILSKRYIREVLFQRLDVIAQ
ncbi:MAG: flagellar basal body-associated FliL family protein [Treponema sp.]|nr:flagellar basal body-associated FliL family protein [Treponema sp.]